jgi:hypothetical protein
VLIARALHDPLPAFHLPGLTGPDGAHDLRIGVGGTAEDLHDAAADGVCQRPALDIGNLMAGVAMLRRRRARRDAHARQRERATGGIDDLSQDAAACRARLARRRAGDVAAAPTADSRVTAAATAAVERVGTAFLLCVGSRPGSRAATSRP